MNPKFLWAGGFLFRITHAAHSSADVESCLRLRPKHSRVYDKKQVTNEGWLKKLKRDKGCCSESVSGKMALQTDPYLWIKSKKLMYFDINVQIPVFDLKCNLMSHLDTLG
ncbi:hypothetical protein FQA47_003878 [Oryzias melastigma]|uniref:Uncharacterized protein n=1 Tax=Oryzias melastigma TaxID=30732 RepID=A0A834F9I2_ORYME|nr:hypothetical protein FQA47_003878 [Oryzias melastigma]